MILPYDYIKKVPSCTNDESDGSSQSINSMNSKENCINSLNKDKNIDNNFEEKYLNTFSENKVQNDDYFYEKFEDLKLGNILNKDLRSDLSSSDSDISATKEDNFIHTDKLESQSELSLYCNASEEIKKEKKNKNFCSGNFNLKNSTKICDSNGMNHFFNHFLEVIEEIKPIKKTDSIDDEKMTLNTSIISNISQSSKNYISKELLYKESSPIYKKYISKNNESDNITEVTDPTRDTNFIFPNFYDFNNEGSTKMKNISIIKNDQILFNNETNSTFENNFQNKQKIYFKSKFQDAQKPSNTQSNNSEFYLNNYNTQNTNNKKHASEKDFNYSNSLNCNYFKDENENLKFLNQYNKNENYSNGKMCLNTNPIINTHMNTQQMNNSQMNTQMNSQINTQMNPNVNSDINTYNPNYNFLNCNFPNDNVDNYSRYFNVTYRNPYNFNINNNSNAANFVDKNMRNNNNYSMNNQQFYGGDNTRINFGNMNNMNNMGHMGQMSQMNNNNNNNNRNINLLNNNNFNNMQNVQIKNKNLKNTSINASKDSKNKKEKNMKNLSRNNYNNNIIEIHNEQGLNHQNASIKKNQKFFRQTNYSEMDENELFHYANFFAKEQAGCRFLQKKLEEDSSFADRLLFPQLYENLLELMIDAFGNYLIQKLLEHISQENLERFVNLVSPCILSLGLNAHGTRVIQKIIESIKSEKLFYLFLISFNPIMLDLMKDVNGNHIIIKFVSLIKYPENKDLYKAVIENIVEISTHKHACCAFQKCIDYANYDQKKLIFEKLVENTYILISDPYGNYVLQYIIMLNDFVINYNIACIFKSNIGYLSKQKFSSNVIEKCFDHCDENTKFIIVKEVCNPKIVVDLLMDMYGNYVLQKVLTCAKDPYYSLLINAIGPHLERLKSVSYGSKLYTKFLLEYPEFNYFLTGSITPNTQKNKKYVNVGKKQTSNNENTNTVVYNNNNPYDNSINIAYMPQNYLKTQNNNGMQNYQYVFSIKQNFDPTENL